ncbi:MAG TPA: hypothetical protein VIF60_06940, partial [Burkholderiaceae bacterium]
MNYHQSIIKLVRRTYLFILSASLTLFAFPITCSAVGNYTVNSNNAYNWLISQKNANGLVTSFQGGNVCYTYDNAVAITAFLLKGDTASAKAVLNEFKSLQLSDGSWYNAYYTNGGVQEGL